MRRKARVDANQAEVISQLRGIPGVKVAITSQLGGGFPDFVIGYQGVNYLIELKDGAKPPSRRKLTEDEKRWHRLWDGYGQVAVCKSFEECCAVIGIEIYEEIPF